MSNKKEVIFDKIATRDFAILLLYKPIIKYYKKVIGIKTANPLYYFSDGVYKLYYNKSYLDAFLKDFARAFKSKRFLNKIIERCLSLAKNLKPFLDKEKFARNKRELEYLVNTCGEFLTYAESMQIILDIKEISKENKKIAINIRKQTHELIRPMDIIIRENVKRVLKKYSDEEIGLLTFDEVFKKKKVSEKELLKRSEKYICYRNNIYSGDGAARFINKNNIRFHDELLTQKNNNILKGQIANPGKTKGIVNIVINKNDIKKVKKGGILVANMTLPMFMPAMKIVKGFITDEGGMGCHAAIYSRELGIPCIIGTKIATKVLKDGDLVEVDANRGIIKKIK